MNEIDELKELQIKLKAIDALQYDLKIRSIKSKLKLLQQDNGKSTLYQEQSEESF